MRVACLLGTGLAATIAISSGCRPRDVPPPPPATTKSPATAPPTKRVVGPLSEADANALATMNERLRAYLALHEALEKGLPTLQAEATPQQIDVHRRMFEKKMQRARQNAKRGEILTPEAVPVIKRLLENVFARPDGQHLRASINDVQPAGVRLDVNARYPETIPVSTVPPDILQTLPRLTEHLEYRFTGRHLILLDTHANVIADYIENAVPPR